MTESADRVQLTWEGEGVAVVTVGGPPPNPCTFAVVDQLAERLQQAREEDARVVVLASSVQGHWLGHASLGDLAALFRGASAQGKGSGFFKAADELSRQAVVTIAAISGHTSGGGCAFIWMSASACLWKSSAMRWSAS